MMRKGTIMYWKKDNAPAYQKQSDDDCAWWLSLDEKEVAKPLEDRYGFKLNDEMVLKQYGLFMDFKFD